MCVCVCGDGGGGGVWTEPHSYSKFKRNHQNIKQVMKKYVLIPCQKESPFIIYTYINWLVHQCIAILDELIHVSSDICTSTLRISSLKEIVYMFEKAFDTNFGSQKDYIYSTAKKLIGDILKYTFTYHDAPYYA